MAGDVPVPGYWWSPDQPGRLFAGVLTTSPLRMAALRIVDPPDGGSDLSRHDRIPMLHGFVEGLGAVTLMDLTLSGMSAGATVSHRFHALNMVAGVWLSRPDEKHFRSVELVAPNLGLLLGEDWPGSSPPERHDRRLEISADSPERRWSGCAVELSISLNWSYASNRHEAKVTHNPVAQFSSARPQPLRYWIDEWIVPFNDLLRIATGINSRFKSVRLWNKKHLTPRERTETAMKLVSPGVGEHEIEQNREPILGRLRLEGSSRDDLLLAIQSAKVFNERHDIFHSRMASVLNEPQRRTQNKYLDLMGAIEALSGRLLGTEPIPASEFKKLRKTSRAELQTTESRSFFDRWMTSKSYYGLNKQIEALQSRIPDTESWPVDTQKMVTLRHDLAHGNPNVDLTYLEPAFDQALALCRKLFVQETGFPIK